MKVNFSHTTKRVLCAVLMAVLVVALLLTTMLGNTTKASAATNAPSNAELVRLNYALSMEREFSMFNFASDDIYGGIVGIVENNICHLKSSNTAMTALSCLTEGDRIMVGETVKGLVSNMSDLEHIASFVEDMNNYEVGQSTIRVYAKIGLDLLNTCLLLNDDSSRFDTLKVALADQCDNLKGKEDMQDYYDLLNGFATSDFCDEAGNVIGYYDWLVQIKDCYLELFETLETNPADSDNAKNAFDKLYVLVSQSKVIPQLMTSDNLDGAPLLDAMYNYYLLNANTQPDVREFLTQGVVKCLSFAHDMYTYYTFTNTCLALCYQYQVEYIQNRLAENEKIEDSAYPMNATKNVSYSSEIVPFAKSYQVVRAQFNAAMSKFYVRLFNLDQIYYMKVADVTQKVIVHELSDYQPHYGRSVGTNLYMTVNDSVPSGATLYLSSLPELLTYMFGSNYTYEISDKLLASVSGGVVNVVGSTGSFDVTLLCDGVEVYTLSFNIGDTPFAGEGTLTSPFLITNETELREIAITPLMWKRSFHYLLVKDITVNESSSSNALITQFEGVFDGGNHTITGKNHRPLFGLNRGTVKNLTLNNANIVEGRDDLLGGNHEFSVGGIVDRNEGTIVNCHVTNSTIAPAYSNVQAGSLLLVGGITGHNMGTIESCTVIDCSINGAITNVTKGEDDEKDLTGFAGSIVGYTGARLSNIGFSGGAISNTLAASNRVTLTVKGISRFTYGWGWFTSNTFYKVKPVGYTGAFVGCAENTSITNVVSIGNSFNSYVTNDTEQASTQSLDASKYQYYTTKVDNKGEFGGVINNTSVTEAYTDGNYGVKLPPEPMLQHKLLELGWVYQSTTDIHSVKAQSLSIVSMPNKTIYNRGEQLNLFGLVLVTDQGEYVYGDVTVSGFDSNWINERCEVTVTWKGLSASFYVYVVCPHAHTATQTDVDETFNGSSVKSTIVTCSDCHKTVYRAYQTNHVWDSGVQTKAPTCTESGLLKYTCQECDATMVEPIPALGHDWNEEDTDVQEATCTADGYVNYTCNRCDTTKSKVLPKLGHNYVEKNKQPATCTEDGYVEYGCSRCDVTRREVLLMLGHNYEVETSQPATCTEDGFEIYVCSICSDSKKENISAQGHQLLQQNAIEPTYTEDGVVEHWICLNCDNHFKDAEGNQQYDDDSWLVEKLGLVRKFNDEMFALDKTDFNSLANALATYNSMSAEQKAEVKENYAVLYQAILAYNEKANKVNQSYDIATNVVSYSLGGIATLSMLAALAFVSKRFF